MKKLFITLLFICSITVVAFATTYPQDGLIQSNDHANVISFDKLSKGEIFFEAYVTRSENVQTINILSISEGTEKIVFSLPVIAGNKLYPHAISPDVWHRFDIKFDLKYNFCKVFIDGQWLTSVLAKNQEQFVNAVSTMNSTVEPGNVRTRNWEIKGALLDFREPLKISLFGNSTTAYRSTITGVYAQRIPEFFQKREIAVQVFNEGIGGSHTGHVTDNALHRVRHALDRFDDLLAKKPNVVTFNFGINDSWVDSNDPKAASRIPLTSFKSNLLYMIDTLKKMRIHVILMTPSGFGKGVSSWRKERTEKYVFAIRDISKKARVPLIDQWKLMNNRKILDGNQIDSFLLPDGIHTNDVWHAVLAEKVFETITATLDRKAGPLNKFLKIN